VGGQALADEQSADAVLGADALADEGLPVGDEGTPLARGRIGHGDGGQLTQGMELGEAEGVVLVGFAFAVFELPGLAGGVGDQAGEADFGAEVVDQPARRQASITTTLGWRRSRSLRGVVGRW